MSPLLDANTLPDNPQEIKKCIPNDALSEFPKFLDGSQHLAVPVYTIYGAAEDLTVLEKFKNGKYRVPNLHIIDESTTYTIKTPLGPTIRLFGLGGSLVLHRLFDHGDGSLSIAGSPGVMWTTLLQIGQLISTVRKSFIPSEIRVFVSHPSPSREGLLAQLAVALRTDFTISSGLHFRYASSFNEYSVLPSVENFRNILAMARVQFMNIWDSVKDLLTSLVDNVQYQQLMLAYKVFESMPILDNQQLPAESIKIKVAGNKALLTSSKTATSNSTSSSAHPSNAAISMEYLELAFSNMWHFNLCDHINGALVLAVNHGRVSSISYSEGFDFAYRLASTPETSRDDNSKAPASASSLSPVPPSVKPIQPTLEKSTASIPKAAESVETKSPSTTVSSNAVPLSSSTIPGPKPSSATTLQPSHAPTTPQEPELPGVWIPNGNADEAQIRSYFDVADQKTIKLVIKKGTYINPKKSFALVHFSTLEEAKNALKRLDLEKAGSRSNLIRQSYGPSSSTGPGSTSDGGSQDNQSSRSGGWSIVGSARGGKGQRRGSSNVVKSPKRASAAILLSNPTS